MNKFAIDLMDVAIGVSILLLFMLIGYYIFSKLTKFDDTKEIFGGNEAVGVYMGSKLLGLSIIIAMVSYNSDSWMEMIIWSAVGIVILSIVYLLFDLCTPKFKVCEEIQKGNMAVAQLIRAVIIGASVVIGTFLM